MPVVTAHLELTAGIDTRQVLLTATEALRRIGVDHATLQLEGEPCGQGRAAASGAPNKSTNPLEVPHDHDKLEISQRIDSQGMSCPMPI